MKKALQLVHFWAALSLPDWAVGSGRCEAHPGSFFYRFAEFFGADRGRPAARLARVLERGLGRRLDRRLGRGRREFGERSGSEPQTGRSRGAEGRTQAPGDLRLE